jgi:hypothetical protein
MTLENVNERIPKPQETGKRQLFQRREDDNEINPSLERLLREDKLVICSH